MSRKAISKKLRFEVFKRDSFTCQYCGGKSPDVVLELDHIVAVASGGDGDILNLVTACRPCNAGKSDRALSDTAVLDKQRAQLEELNERREQLEMMIAWRDGLNQLNDRALEAIQDRLREKTGYTLNEKGEAEARKWITRYGLANILAALEDAFNQYGRVVDGKITSESWNDAWNRIPKVIRGKKIDAEKPYMKEIFYIRGILRNRLDYIHDRDALTLMERAHLAGASLSGMSDLAKSVSSWTRFREELVEYLSEHEQ